MTKILLVDDDANIRLTLEVLLEDEGFCVRVAASFREATSMLSAPDAAYDVVLLDHRLGDGFGTALLPLVRERLPLARAIIMSGDVDDAAIAACDVDARLAKGASFLDVLQVIRAR